MVNDSDGSTESEYYDFDPSQEFYPGERRYVPHWEIWIKCVFYTIIIGFSLLGNILIVLIVYRHKRMRTTTNFYIVNLAIADLMVTLSCTWVSLVDDVTEGWVLGEYFCKFNTFAHVLSLVASVLTLTLIAYDRFFGIVFAMKAHMSERKAKTSIIVVWVCSVIVGSPLLFFRILNRRQWKDHLELWCDDDWPVSHILDPVTNTTRVEMPWRTAYYTGVSVVLFFMPMLVMSIAYSVIIWTLKTQTAPGENVPRNNSGQNRARKKVIFMLVVILVVFAVCWLPTQVYLLYTEHRTERLPMGDWYHKFEFAARYLAYCNSALNPLIYAGFNDNFKQGLWKILGIATRKPSFLCGEGKSYGTYSSTGLTSVQLVTAPGADSPVKGGMAVTAV
ncbi:substance-P receptor-like [Haliotis asinina]|uniref:substance-P receptor-like n=1 Tax=Haliotis asinina TaxID=109174 RepID=UPI0035326762